MNTSSRTRSITVATTAIALLAFGACGVESSPPAQDIGRDQVQKKDSPAGPTRTTGNRLNFGDEAGTVKLREREERKERPIGTGTRNRIDFDTYHGR